MIIVLLTVFAIAVVMIIAGLLLSFKPPTSMTHDHKVSYATDRHRTRYAGGSGHSYADGDRGYRVGETRRMYARRAPMEVERRAWSGILHSLNVGRVFTWRPGTQAPWLGIVLTLCVLFLISLSLMRSVLPGSTTLIDTNWAGTANFGTTDPQPGVGSAGSAGSSVQPFSGMIGASKALIRLNQLDAAQYASTQEYSTWADSTCSAASMTEVINAYGHHFRITDILKVEAGIGEITPALGLLYPNGIDLTVAQFNFQTTWLHNPSLTDVINVANQGRPVIVNFPPSRWSGGHLLVVTGGTKDYVYLADSSALNMRAMAQKTFMKYWVGFAVVVTPK